MLAKAATEMFRLQGYNVLMDVTLGSAKSALAKYVDADYAQDYKDISVALVDGDMKNSLNNAGNRYKQTDTDTGDRTWEGRFTPMSLVDEPAPTRAGHRRKNEQDVTTLSQSPRGTRPDVSAT